MSPKWSPFGEKKIYPTTVFVRCKCGNELTIRTNTQLHDTPCWHEGCARQVRVVLGLGKNNISVYILEGSKKPEKWSNFSYNQ